MAGELALPRFVVLRGSTGKYLSYVVGDVRLHGFFQFSADNIESPYSKFELETAKSGDDLVHIKCFYNKKYLVKFSQDEDWIVGQANEPEEDQSKSSCTLFKPVVVDSTTKRFNFLHVQLGRYLDTFAKDDSIYVNCVHLNQTSSKEEVTVIDLDSFVILPKYVSFKGDNGKYLSAGWTEGYPYHEFASDNAQDTRVHYEVFPVGDGSVRIKSNFFGKFWRRSPNWIWADTDDTTNQDPNTLFWPVKARGKLALKNLGNNYYCKRLTTEGKTSCLNAGASEITLEAQLDVEEAVLSREIYNVSFHMKDSKIYNSSYVTSLTQDVDNWSEESKQEGQVSFSYTKSTSNTWNNSRSWSVGVSTTISTGIPFLEKGAISIEASYGGEHSWGKTEETSTEVGTNLTVSIPPMTKTVVTMVVTKGSMDIPYSYTQRDTLSMEQLLSLDCTMEFLVAAQPMSSTALMSSLFLQKHRIESVACEEDKTVKSFLPCKSPGLANFT